MRKQLRDELLAALGALSLGAPVGVWRGDPFEFADEAATAPSVWLAYGGALPGPLAGRGRKVWDRDLFFDVYVFTAEDTHADPEGQALDLLDAVERGLVNLRPASGVTVEAAGEEQQQRVVLGRYLYGQRYRAKALVSQLS